MMLRQAAEIIALDIPMYEIEYPRRPRARKRTGLNLSGLCLQLAVSELNELANELDA